MNQVNNKQLAILLIEQDDETRPLLKQNLRTLGYLVINELDEIGAVERIRGSRIKPNLILINQIEQTVDASLSMGRRIRRDANLPDHTLIIIYADEFGPDLQGQDVQVGDYEYVTYPEDGEQLFSLISRVLPLVNGA
ncbi:MAG: hypothetical protein ACTS2F_09860 [Thainema sp.]